MIRIKGKNYNLSVRKTLDYLNLVSFVGELPMPEEGKPLTGEQLKTDHVIKAQTIYDSIKATYSNYSNLRKIFARKYKKLLLNGVVFILDNSDPFELNLAFQNIMEMEGSKKKATIAEGSRSAEM